MSTSLFDFTNLPAGALAWHATTTAERRVLGSFVGAYVVQGSEASRRASQPVDPAWIEGGEEAYVSFLVLAPVGSGATPNTLYLSLSDVDGDIGSGAGPSFTAAALDSLGLAIRQGGHTVQYRLADLLANDADGDVVEPYIWDGVVPEITEAVVRALAGPDTRALLVEISDAIDWPNLALLDLPDTPAAPSVASGGRTAVLAAFAAAATGDPATGFDLRWRVRDTGDWTLVEDATTPAEIGGLVAGTEYEVQVRAVNGRGPGAWSASGTATTDVELTLNEWRLPAGRAEVDAALIEAEPDGIDTLYRSDSDPTGTLLDGGLLVWPAYTLSRIRRFANGFQLGDNPSARNIANFFTSGFGADQRVHLQDAGGAAAFDAATTTVNRSGANFIRWRTDADLRAVLDRIGSGDRFILAFTRAAPPATRSLRTRTALAPLAAGQAGLAHVPAGTHELRAASTLASLASAEARLTRQGAATHVLRAGASLAPLTDGEARLQRVPAGEHELRAASALAALTFAAARMRLRRAVVYGLRARTSLTSLADGQARLRRQRAAVRLVRAATTLAALAFAQARLARLRPAVHAVRAESALAALAAAQARIRKREPVVYAVRAPSLRLVALGVARAAVTPVYASRPIPRPAPAPSAIELSLAADGGDGVAHGYPALISLAADVTMENWELVEAAVAARTLRAASDVDGPAVHGRVRGLIEERVTLLAAGVDTVARVSRLLNAVNAGAARAWLQARRLGETRVWRSPLRCGSLQLDGASLHYGRGRRRYVVTVIREPWFEDAGAPVSLGSHALSSRTPLLLTAPDAGTLAAPLMLTLTAAAPVGSPLRLHLYQDRAVPASWTPAYAMAATAAGPGHRGHFQLHFAGAAPRGKDLGRAALTQPLLVPVGSANAGVVRARRDGETLTLGYGRAAADLNAETEAAVLGRLAGQASVFSGFGPAAWDESAAYAVATAYAGRIAGTGWQVVNAPADGYVAAEFVNGLSGARRLGAGGGLALQGGPLHASPLERIVLLPLIETLGGSGAEYAGAALTLDVSLRPRVSELQ